MKKPIIVLFCICWVLLTGKVFAQDIPASEQPQVEERTSINFYGGLLAEPHVFNQQFGLNMGATMGINYLDHWYFGGYYTALVTQNFRFDIPDHLNAKLKASFNHGGLIAGYIWKPEKLVNLNFAMRAGWGSIWYYDPGESNSDKLEENFRGTRDRIFVLTPQVELTFTPIEWIRIGVGVGYRTLAGLDRYSRADYDSPIGIISLSFGSFRASTEMSKDIEVNPE